MVHQSLPMFAILGQRAAFLKLRRGRGVYDAGDGGFSLASFRSVSKMVLLKMEPPTQRRWAVKEGVLEDWRQRHNNCEPGLRKWDDRWPNQVAGEWTWCCAGLSFPLPSVHELGPRPQRRKQVRAWLSDKRCEEDVNTLISNLNRCSWSQTPCATDLVPTPRQGLVIARVRELSWFISHSRCSRSWDSERLSLSCCVAVVCTTHATADSAWPVFVRCQKSRRLPRPRDPPR